MCRPDSSSDTRSSAASVGSATNTPTPVLPGESVALMPNAPKKWDRLGCDDQAVTRLADALQLPAVVARLLCQRGFAVPEDAQRFLHPALDQLHDPMLLADMPVAIERI